MDVEPAFGQVCLEQEDFSLNGENPIFFTRRYNNHARYDGPFGIGWMHPFDVHLAFRNGQFFLLDTEARLVTLSGLAEQRRVELPAEDLIAEHVGGHYLIHQGEGRTLAFSDEPLPGGRLPLVRVDQTDENSVFLSYRDGRLGEIRTSSFHQLRFEYQGHRISRISIQTSEEGAVPLASYTYHNNGLLAAAFDAEDRPVRYEYSGDLLTRCTNRMGESFYLEYDNHRRATAAWQDGLSRLRRIRRDDQKKTRLVTDSLGHSTLLRYNDNMLLIETTSFDGAREERAYANGNEPLAILGAEPQPISTYDPVENTIEQIDPDGGVTRLRYDERNRVVEETEPGGGVTRYEYDDRNRITKHVSPTGGVTTFEFNDIGNLIRQVQPLGNEVSCFRSGTGRLELVDSLGPVYISQHDSFGNTTRIVAPSGHTTAYEYDKFGRLTGFRTEGSIARSWYDAEGYLAAETDLVGNRTSYEHDAFGLLLAWTNPLGRRIEYEYDSERRLIGARSHNGIECRYDYDFFGRLLHMKLRDGREETISYDDNGRRSAMSDSGGSVTRYSYTASGLISAIESSSGSALYEFDLDGNYISADYDGHSIKRECAPGELLISELQDEFGIAYEYNAAGLVTTRKDATRRTTSYGYNVRGDVKEIVDSLFGTLEIHRDRLGSESAHHLPNGIVREFSYGPDDEISHVITRNQTGQPICDREYQYAANGELISAATAGGERLHFEYDAEYRLTSVSAIGDGQEPESFAYDLDDNITSNSLCGEYSYNQGHLIRAGDIVYEYDGSGRVIAKSRAGKTTRFSYGLGGLIREVVLPDGNCYRYEYDGFGRRVLKVGPGIRIQYHWDEDVLLCEERQTEQGKSVISYLFLPDTFLPVGHAVDGKCFYYELDQRALIREVYDATGAVRARFAYRAFGARHTIELSAAEADPPFRLQGQIYDAETGLCYNRFRYYDPEVGRFLSPDLSTQQVEHNPYSYSPNPINWADPYGLMARFSRSDADSLKAAQKAKNKGFYKCVNCGFRNKNKVFAQTPGGRPVGDGSFHAGHKNPHAKGGSANINRNAQVEGGTCNCSKGKRKSAGMT